MGCLGTIRDVLVPPRRQSYQRHPSNVQRIMSHDFGDGSVSRSPNRYKGQTAKEVRAVLIALSIAGAAIMADRQLLDSAVAKGTINSLTALIGRAVDNALGIYEVERDSDGMDRMYGARSE